VEEIVKNEGPGPCYRCLTNLSASAPHHGSQSQWKRWFNFFQLGLVHNHIAMSEAASIHHELFHPDAGNGPK